MTERAEIERLLNETGFTLEGLPELYSMKQCEDAIIRSGLTVGMAGNMICHQTDVIERLVNALRSALDLAPKWISVKDDLPAHVIDSFLVCYDDGLVGIADWSHDLWENDWWFYTDGEYDIDGITHWMPLPEPPKEES